MSGADLVEHLREAARSQFIRGRTDCALFMADWVVKKRGVDPAAPLRGRYRTAIGAARHINRLGGFEAMGRNLMASIGCATTTEPKPGDVGLVRDPIQGPLFAIKTDLGWAAKAPQGVAVGPFPVIVAWAV